MPQTAEYQAVLESLRHLENYVAQLEAADVQARKTEAIISKNFVDLSRRYLELLDAHTVVQTSANGYVDENRALRQVYLYAQEIQNCEGQKRNIAWAKLHEALAAAEPLLQVRQ